MAVRTLHDNWKFYYSPNCQMYEGVRQGTVIDGDLGVYLAQNAPNDVEVIDVSAPDGDPAAVTPPASTEPDAPVDPPVEPVTSTGESAKAPAESDYDPAAFNGAQVIAYVKEHPEQAAAVLAAEQSGKQRTTVLAALASAH